MIRRTLLALAFAALPLPASAADGDGAPLRTLCSSATMDYCVSIWTWDFAIVFSSLEGDPPQALYAFTGSADMELTGSGWPNVWEVRFAVRLPLPTVPYLIDDTALHGQEFREPLGEGIYRVGERTGPFEAPTRQPNPYDIEGMTAFGPNGRVWLCGNNDGGSGDPCYEPVSVPEPSSLLLLATGLGGVVITVRRRRA